jgi:antitoxin component YwqK of YwqJK toxin-antitoxin module
VSAAGWIGALAALAAAACGPTWSDVSRSLADPSATAERGPRRDRQRSWYDAAATRPRTEVELLLYPDGRSLKDGIERRWFGDGTLEFERGWSRGEPRGWWRSWWPDGTPRHEHRFDPDQLTPMRWWYPNGVLSSQGPAREGVREGTWRARHPGGEPAWEGGFEAGRRAGPWIFWHPDGSLAERGSYRAGVREGTWETFAPGQRADEAPRWVDGADGAQ